MAHRAYVRIANRLRQIRNLLEQPGEAGFHSQAYRRSSSAVERLTAHLSC